MLFDCSEGLQPNFCPRTTDDALPSVLGKLPPGPAWDGASISGTYSNQYWRSFASVIGFTYGRLCDFVDEFFCATVNESRDQWIADYGLNDPCDPYGRNLCLKVAAEGGTTCDYFVHMAYLSGWVITCHDTSTDPEPIAGDFQVGCTSLGPTPVLATGSTIGLGVPCGCDYGEVVNHPDPGLWENGHTDGAVCKVPGSNLGEGPDTDESCCFIVGYYEVTEDVAVDDQNYCAHGTTITFDCPATPRPTLNVSGCDTTGLFIEYGNAHVWEVTVDIAASQTLQGTVLAPTEDPDQTISAAGNFMVGDATCGTPLCAAVDVPSIVLCFLDRIRPAHTTLVTHVKLPEPAGPSVGQSIGLLLALTQAA